MEYSTKQRKTLLNFFENNAHKKFTCKQILDEINDEKISLSSIYRNLLNFEKEGLLQRFSEAGSQEICWQFNHAHGCNDSLHLTCTNCGKTFHIKQEIVSDINENLSKNAGFSIDKSKTILYGTCKSCNNTKNAKLHAKI